MISRDNEILEKYSEDSYEKGGGCCCCKTWKKCLKWSLIGFFTFLLFLFILIWVIFPIIFMCTVSIQRFLIFPAFKEPSNPEYDNFEKYGATGVRNIYVTLRDLDDNSLISLGVWHVLPEKLINESLENQDFSFDDALNSTEHDVIIYCHGNSGTRIHTYPTYVVLREFFHVIAMDYRGYGDSSPNKPSEKSIVNDLIQFYQWVRSKTPAKIYVWGHSLGSSLSTHLVMKLNEMDIVPTGLALEAPFTTIRDEIALHPLGKVFAWLLYFDATIRDPLERNEFLFKTTHYILNVTCPVMIVHAEDDIIIPSSLGEKLYNSAKENNHLQSSQDMLTLHLIDAKYKLGHMKVTQYEKMPEYIEKWKEVCDKLNSGKG
nr:monoacylglycerol lipase ABHD12-like isoform X1 [Onthophagus taurus]XP_022920283.1 monoacylglycerol lipase ABHD12-like isoform X1 [Onthophagus taurus]